MIKAIDFNLPKSLNYIRYIYRWNVLISVSQQTQKIAATLRQYRNIAAILHQCCNIVAITAIFLCLLG